MSPRDWLRPPVPLLTMVGATVLVSIVGLVSIGRRALESERAAAAQESRQHVEDGADRIAADLKSAVALATVQLGAWILAPPVDKEIPEGALLLIFDAQRLRAVPAGRLLYRPFAETDQEPRNVFTRAEALEFKDNRLGEAAAMYETLAKSAYAAERAGALLRLGRVLMKSGNTNAAVQVYEQLAGMGTVRIAGVPAELLGRHLRCNIQRDKAQAERLLADLEHGRWALTRGQFNFYWAEETLAAGRDGALPAGSALAEAAAAAWRQQQSGTAPSGVETMWAEDRPWVTFWQASGGKRAALITAPGEFFAGAVKSTRLRWKVMDAGGRVVAGDLKKAAQSAVRASADTQLPWTLAVAAGEEKPAALDGRKRLLIAGLGAAIAFLLLASYFIARTVRREAEIARLQLDFVSAVSHEFRSPLASMRHLSEMLALGRVPDEARRSRYYDTLVRETRRLQRQVEALLNFGRMEAGVKPGRLAEVDAGEVARQAAAEFAPLAAAEGRRIEVETEPGGLCVEADAEALGLAVTNLIDNALKYSPGTEAIWVKCELRNQRVAIAIRDEGIGIGKDERRKIFAKFVRGSAAEKANAKGTGLGLAMVEHIAAAHGGEIDVESEPGKGSVFTLLLPAKKS